MLSRRLPRGLAALRARHLSTAPAPLPRLVKLVSTIGPASEEAAPLAGCVAAGMNVMRVNFSHATVDEFHLRRNNLRAAPGGAYVSVMLDTKGPEIRMGGLKVCKETGNRKAKIELKMGAALTLTNDKAFDGASDESTLFIDYENLAGVLKAGDTVLLDDGLISLEVVSTGAGAVETTVLNSSEIGERKGVNLPGVITGLPAMSPKDIEDIRFGIEHDIDMVAASFVRNAEGVHQIREHIHACHEQYHGTKGLETPPPLIISKIESTESLDNLGEIIEASDGIMVARGDLGVEVPLEQVVNWQKDMVAMCMAAGKPVVVATQMLETMQKNPRPTRAEVSDVTNAVLELADAVMLSGESANGQYPTESVATQASIVLSTEAWALARGMPVGGDLPPASYASLDGGDAAAAVEGEDDFHREETIMEGLSQTAVFLASRIGARAIVVLEDGWGDTARAVAKHRPPMPIAALCDSIKVCRQLSISRGVYPVLVEMPALDDDASEDGEGAMEPMTLDMLDASDACAVVSSELDLLSPGDLAVVLHGDVISVETVTEDDWEVDESE